MTMVKSYTKRKFASPAKSEIRAVSNAATDYIKQWTTRELGKLQSEQTSPLCLPLKNGYKIGLYTLRVYPNKTCELFDYNNDLVHIFENKISAILYAIYTIKRKYWAADEIRAIDTVINKNYTDMLSLRRSIESAKKRQDYVSVDIKQIKLDIAETQLTQARNKMAQIHRYAKTSKVWE